MTAALRKRLARLEAKNPPRRQVILVLPLSDEQTAEAERLRADPDVDLFVIDTGIPYRSEDQPCAA